MDSIFSDQLSQKGVFFNELRSQFNQKKSAEKVSIGKILGTNLAHFGGKNFGLLIVRDFFRPKFLVNNVSEK
jgi:hypothetical protein